MEVAVGVGVAVRAGEEFQERSKKILRGIARQDWNKAVVLADSELEGIAGAGALSFKEIALMPADYYHLLDVRHGPILLIDKKTLVIAVCSPNGISRQKDLISDLKKKSPLIVEVSGGPQKISDADYWIPVPAFRNFGVTGIPFIFIPQALSLFKAVGRGINPDLPQGLCPWIVLKEKE